MKKHNKKEKEKNEKEINEKKTNNIKKYFSLKKLQDNINKNFNFIVNNNKNKNNNNKNKKIFSKNDYYIGRKNSLNSSKKDSSTIIDPNDFFENIIQSQKIISTSPQKNENLNEDDYYNLLNSQEFNLKEGNTELTPKAIENLMKFSKKNYSLNKDDSDYGNLKTEVEKSINKAYKIFGNIDYDNNGTISFDEFVKAAIDKKKLLTEEKLKAAFALFDRNGDGDIEAKELKEVIGDDNNNEDNIWDQMIKEVDLDGNGVIDFEEFKEMMKKLCS
jgi:Ca2+-binding EF-hand superfamily protein